MIEIPRLDLIASLESAAKEGSLLVIGEPGAGKSWIVNEFVARRKASGDGVVLLKAEDYAPSSLEELQKTIGVRDLVGALRAFPEERRFLVIDSLDALRAEPAQRSFRQLIRMVQREAAGWVVVASMRTFDARQSAEFQQLFPLRDEPISDSLPIPARNFYVPVFSDLEIAEAARQDTRLRPLFEVASLAARKLLRNPFNLWLMIQLLEGGVPVERLLAIRSEVQLLDRYWQYRVEGRADSGQRRALLTGITKLMVDSNSLSIASRDTLAEDAAHMKTLLSDDLIRTSTTDRISYSHNILFDFAVARLLLDETNLVAFLLAEPARIVFYRPSISYFLARIWFADRSLFWRVVSAFFQTPDVLPVHAGITPAAVITDVSHTFEDLAGVFDLRKAFGPRVVVFVLRAIQAFDMIGAAKRSLWLEFLTSLSSDLDTAFLNEYTSLLVASSNVAEYSLLERKQLGESAIRLLRWFWAQSETAESEDAAGEFANFASRQVIPLVSSLYATCPADARQILHEVLTRLGAARSASNEPYSLANSIEGIIAADPGFATEIYVTISAYEETSDEETSIGGPVFRMRGTRKQDVSMARYALGIKYPLFLRRDYLEAARASVLSVTAETERTEAKTIKSLGAYDVHFLYAGQEARLRSDRSEIWDQSHRDHPSLELFMQMLAFSAKQSETGILSDDQICEMLQLVATTSTYAVVWKRLLEFGSRNPAILRNLSSVLRVPELLAAPETTVAAGKAIAEVFEKELYSQEERRSIEAAVLAIPGCLVAGAYKDPEKTRNRLLGCIAESALGAESSQIVRALKQTTGVPENRPFFEMGSTWTGQVSEEELLRERGVQTGRPENQNLLTAHERLKPFELKFLNEKPSEAECLAIEEDLKTLFRLLVSEQKADEQVVTLGLGTACAVAEEVLKNDSLPRDSSIVVLCWEIVQAGASHPFPPVPADADVKFDRPAWAPTPRVEAAQGVMHFIWGHGLDQVSVKLVEQLVSDPAPAVRYQVCVALITIYKHDRELFWSMAHSRLRQEKATGVLVALARSVTHPHVAGNERGRVVEWIEAALGREPPEARPEDLLQVLADSLTQMFVYFGDASADGILARFERDAARYSSELIDAIESASHYLVRNTSSNSAADAAVQNRAQDIFGRVLAASDEALRKVLTAPPEGQPQRTKGPSAIEKVLRVTDAVVFRLYAVMGVNPQLNAADRPSLEAEAGQTMFTALRPLWQRLTTPLGVGQRRILTPSTTHYLAEIFRFALPTDPSFVLGLLSELLKAHNFGYAYDSMAKDEVVALVNTVLADHKDILRDPTAAASLGSILDAFVDASWPEATKLVMQLDDAIR